MLILTLFSVLVAFLITKFYLKARTLPPGPIPFLFLGNLPQLAFGFFRGKGAVDTMQEWREKYGPVFTFWLEPTATVSICTYELSNEAMVKNGRIFVDKTYMFLMDIVRNGRGIIFSNGDLWLEQRRFALHSFRNMGLGKNVMQHRIMDELDYRLNLLSVEVEKNSGSLTIDPQHFLDLTVGNVINRMLFTERFTEEKETKFFELKKRMDDLMKNATIFDIAIAKWNQDFPLIKQRLEFLMGPMNDFILFFKEQIQQRKEEIYSGRHELRGEGDDFVDSFLIQIKETREKGLQNSFDEDSLMVTLLDLWIAGQETSATTLYWAFNYLLLHPHVTSKLQQELESVVVDGESLTLEDRPRTPYLNAVITEVLRLSSVVSVGMWRESSEDTVVGGFFVPKGTAVTAQLSLILQDSQHFHHPHEFIPERFLSEEERLDQFVAAFGFGKRVCLAESLARAEIYLILGNFVLNYEMRPSSEAPPALNPPLNMEPMRKAKPYKMEICKRQRN